MCRTGGVKARNRGETREGEIKGNTIVINQIIRKIESRKSRGEGQEQVAKDTVSRVP